ncbi:dihydroxyacetone kinase phosphoryl donor subunit DhaM [Orbus mooreae]|uniref:dihydroxyacetone kinase phosphoryl donor subunit DhaM n=1 Tax=Orbus mooreae TaxID=3074107 RepID=UPI00370D3294
MISFILVSHSKKITDGLKEMIDEMALNQEQVTIFSVGGTSDGRLGTDPIAIYNTIESRKADEAILVFTDMGSAVLSSEAAIDMLDDEVRDKVHLVDCALVEGAFIAAVQVKGSQSLQSVFEELKSI